MKVLFLGNNRVGWEIVTWLQERGDEIVGLVLHPAGKRQYGQEIAVSAKVNPDCVFDGSLLRDPATLDRIQALDPEVGVSAFFGYILRPEFLSLIPAGCINVHPALLPYNRGAYPNVWSIVDGTPAGVTIHYIDAGVDTGDIVAQRQVPVDMTDTGESLYRKLEEACVGLFTEIWPSICAGKAPRRPQDLRAGTFHRVSDVAQIDSINLDDTYTAGQLLNILRARTFAPHQGAYFLDSNRKIYIRVQLLTEADLQRQTNGTSH